MNVPVKQDEELYKSYLESGNREVIASMFRKYMALVFGVCMKYLGDRSQAQDATMEVFERLITFVPKDEIRNFKAYLYVMTRNHCLMKKRGEKAYQFQISAADMETAVEMHPIDTGETLEKQLKKCLGQLKDLQKQCVEAFYLSKKSYLEISTELKVTLNAVKSHIQNGKRNLKICLDGKE